MDIPVSVGDQQAYHNLVEEATLYLEAMSQRLADAYNELYSQNVDIEDLGSATEALIFAADKLKQQKITLEAYCKELRKEITSELGEENR
jgi:hypothetical protein